MLAVILGFLAGLLAGSLAFALLHGGVLGLVIGAVVAVVGYIGVSSLFERSRTIGGRAAELVPDGEQAIRVIDEANARVGSISAISSRIRNGYVNKEAADFIAATNDLIRYVNTDPHAYPTLRHYINVYGEQTESLLKGYLDVERSVADDSPAVAQTVKALRALERTAAGELQRAVAAKTLTLAADSEAIVRLASMDGYDMQDDEEDAAATAGTPEGSVAPTIPDGVSRPGHESVYPTPDDPAPRSDDPARLHGGEAHRQGDPAPIARERGTGARI